MDMCNKYYIRKIKSNCLISAELWDETPFMAIDCYPWNINDYKPVSFAKMLYSDTHIHVLMTAFENQIKAEFEKTNDPVYKDSCLELFLNPCPEMGHKYINLECNPLGTVLLGIGKNRYDRILIHDTPQELLAVKHSVIKAKLDDYRDTHWSVEFSISLPFLEKYLGKFHFANGKMMRGNFYKCGDETAYPHYGCWNQVCHHTPDFHKPEYFGYLIMQ